MEENLRDRNFDSITIYRVDVCARFIRPPFTQHVIIDILMLDVRKIQNKPEINIEEQIIDFRFSREQQARESIR